MATPAGGSAWPPIEWRAAPTETGRPSAAAAFSSARRASSHASPVTCVGCQCRANRDAVEPARVIEVERGRGGLPRRRPDPNGGRRGTDQQGAPRDGIAGGLTVLAAGVRGRRPIHQRDAAPPAAAPSSFGDCAGVGAGRRRRSLLLTTGVVDIDPLLGRVPRGWRTKVAVTCGPYATLMLRRRHRLRHVVESLEDRGEIVTAREGRVGGIAHGDRHPVGEARPDDVRPRELDRRLVEVESRRLRWSGWSSSASS